MPPRPASHSRLSLEESLRRDAELLARAEPATRVAVLDGPIVSVGVAVRPEAQVVERCRRLGVPVLRRTTGGRAVLHLAGDLVWSLVLPRTDPRVGVDYVHAYDRLGAAPVHFLSEVGLEGRWTQAIAISDDCCLLGPEGSPLVVGERAVGGAAQHRTRSALLHQGMIQARIDRELLERVFAGDSPTTLRRVAGLEELGVKLAPEDLAARLKATLAAWRGPTPPAHIA